MTDRITGTALALYPMGELTDATKRALDTARPSIVMPHGGPTAILAHGPSMVDEIRARLGSSTRILFGVGCDTWTAQAVRGEITAQAAVDAFLHCADVAAGVGALGPVYDPEGASEGHDTRVARHPIASEIALGTLQAVRSKHPTLVIGHTAYDVPVAVRWTDAEGHVHVFGGHDDYPWTEWCGLGGADLDLPQVYWSPQRGLAPPGSGPWRLARHLDSWQLATAKGMVAAAAQHAVYVQAHGSTVRDLCAVADRFSLRAFWAANGTDGDTLDERGLCALAIECALERRGTNAHDFQIAEGIPGPDVVGQKCAEALGVRWVG
jgi:hypothetical protein